MPAAPVEAAPSVIGTGPIDQPLAAPSGGPPRLEVSGTGAVINLPDKDEILVGREDPLSEPPIFPDVDLTPYGGEEGGVSRRHARIFRQGGQYFLEDLHSTNYTKLDGMKLAPRTPQALQSGARIDFGKVSLFFRA
jgi:pSer/pThr/pTyr-binding forkhead associated (FHA) protein